MSLKPMKINYNIVYHNPHSNTWDKALVIGRSGQATGPNKYCFYVKTMYRANFLSTDFSKITDCKLLNEEIISNSSETNDIQILNAKMKETDNWKKHGKTFLKSNKGQSTISVRWVVTKKNKTEKVAYKVCLVEQGFEEIKKEDTRKDSPMCCKGNVQLVLSITVSNK